MSALTTPDTLRQLLVRRDDIHRASVVTSPLPSATSLIDGTVLLRVDRFGFSANNITYVTLGAQMRYWDFFPATDGWGCIPVWGFAYVVASRRHDMSIGERFFGYWPMASHAIVQPGHVSPHGFTDTSPHRVSLPAVYNQYQRTAGDPSYDMTTEDAYMILRPLFVTSFMLDDFLADAHWFDAEEILISSASSKTAYALAFLLTARAMPRPRLVGLTSRTHLAFVESLGCYDRVLAYDDVTSLGVTAPVVYLDFSGSATVRASIHHHFGTKLAYSAAVGLTHWETLAPAADLPGAKPTLFFAPTHIKRRAAEWGPGGIEQRAGDAWRAFLVPLQSWMTISRLHGGDAALALYQLMLDGNTTPDCGYVLQL